jgi:hypothetical protein
MNPLISYLEKYGLLSLEKQDKLAQLIGEHFHQLNLHAGEIRFNGLKFPFQVLGTESDNTSTWLWAWADEQEEIPKHLTSTSRELKQWGSREDLKEFTIPSVDLDRADGTLFALIASEICRASCFYRDVYEGGSLFVLIFDTMIDSQLSFDLDRLSKQFLYLISRYDLNQRTALLSYLAVKGVSLSEGISRIACLLESGELLRAEFDESGRLVTLNGQAVEL